MDFKIIMVLFVKMLCIEPLFKLKGGKMQTKIPYYSECIVTEIVLLNLGEEISIVY